MRFTPNGCVINQVRGWLVENGIKTKEPTVVGLGPQPNNVLRGAHNNIGCAENVSIFLLITIDRGTVQHEASSKHIILASIHDPIRICSYLRRYTFSDSCYETRHGCNHEKSLIQ